MYQDNFKIGPTKEVKALIFMTVLALALVIYIVAIQYVSKETKPEDASPKIPSIITDAEQDARLQELIKRKAAEGGANNNYEGIDPNETSIVDGEEFNDLSREEAEKLNTFIPMSGAFLPLEYAATQIYRTKLQERYLVDKNIELQFPDGKYQLVRADSVGVTILRNGKEEQIIWSKLPASTFYAYALTVHKNFDRLEAKALIYLAQLADLADKKDDAAKYRKWASRVYFKDRFAELLNNKKVSIEIDGVTYGENGASELSTSSSNGDVKWQDAPPALIARAYAYLAQPDVVLTKAFDAFHLSRIYKELGKEDLVQQTQKIAIDLYPMLLDEIELRPQLGLNTRILDEYSWAWDPVDNLHSADARSAHNLSDDAISIQHIYRYMRTLGEERLDAMSLTKRDTYTTMLKHPLASRGQLFKVRGKYVRQYKRLRFKDSPKRLASGVNEVSFFFVHDAKVIGGLYIICVPHSLEEIKHRDFIEFKGMYLRRWPYEHDGKTHWIPWVVAWDVKKVVIPPSKGLVDFTTLIVVVAIIGAIVLFVISRHDWKASQDSLKHRHTRRRGVRDNIKGKVKDALNDSTASKEDENS